MPKPTKTKSSNHYILIYTPDRLEDVGKKTWYTMSMHTSEPDAIAALLAMNDTAYAHARIIKVKLPTTTLPGDFKTIAGDSGETP